MVMKVGAKKRGLVCENSALQSCAFGALCLAN